MALYFFLGGNIKQLTRRAELITKILENNLHYDNNDHYCFFEGESFTRAWINPPSSRPFTLSSPLLGWLDLPCLVAWLDGCPWVARNSIGASLPSAGGLTRILRLPPSPSSIFSFPILIFQNLFVCGPTCNHPPPFFSFFSFLLELFSSLLPLLFLYLNQPTWTMLPSHW